MPGGGHETCPVAVTVPARWWPWDLPRGGRPPRGRGGSGQGVHPLAGDGLGEAHGVAAGLADAGVVQQPVDGGGGQGLGHEFVEPGGMQVGRECDGALLVGGVDEAVEPFGGVGRYRQQADVVELCGYPHRSTSSASPHSTTPAPSCCSGSSPPPTNAAPWASARTGRSKPGDASSPNTPPPYPCSTGSYTTPTLSSPTASPTG